MIGIWLTRSGIATEIHRHRPVRVCRGGDAIHRIPVQVVLLEVARRVVDADRPERPDGDCADCEGVVASRKFGLDAKIRREDNRSALPAAHRIPMRWSAGVRSDRSATWTRRPACWTRLRGPTRGECSGLRSASVCPQTGWLNGVADSADRAGRSRRAVTASRWYGSAGRRGCGRPRARSACRVRRC